VRKNDARRHAAGERVELAIRRIITPIVVSTRESLYLTRNQLSRTIPL
jgi:hypothetical protein